VNDLIIEPGEIATITIDRPEKRNALTVSTTQQIAEAVEACAASSRVIVLTGAGEGFSAGGDFNDLVSLSQVDPEIAAERLYSGFQAMIRSIRAASVPVIAAINGHAMGAGMDLALACDLRVAERGAKLGQVWVKVGIIPGTGGAFWTTLLAGATRASEMLLTGKTIDAETAHEWGLVNEVVDDGQALARATELASEIVKNPPGAVAANKRALDEVLKPGYEAALDYAKKTQPSRFASEEFREIARARAKK